MPLSFEPAGRTFSRWRFRPMWVVMLFTLAARFIRRTNIIDIVQESHKSEPIRTVPRWYGPAGILLMLLGAVLGYMMPTFFRQGATLVCPLERWTRSSTCPPLPACTWCCFNTVVNGWRRGAKPL